MAYCTYLFEHFEHYNIYYCISDRFKLCQWSDQREWRISMTQITFSNIIYLQVSTWTSEDGITQKRGFLHKDRNCCCRHEQIWSLVFQVCLVTILPAWLLEREPISPISVPWWNKRQETSHQLPYKIDHQ